MKIYIAGPVQNGRLRAKGFNSPALQMFDGFRYPHILESFHYLRKPSITAHFHAWREESKESVFLDSGAFSMFTQGAQVDLGEFADFYHAAPDAFHAVSNVDVIGRGQESASWSNLKALEKLGVPVCPVHHARDADKWLEKYLAEGYPYLFLGGMVPETTEYLTQWLDHVWGKYLANKDGTAKIKVHGFGSTTVDLMRRYPWFSVDSTSWVMAGSFGSIYICWPDGRTMTISVSDQSPKLKTADAHLDTLDPLSKRAVEERVVELGYTLDNLRAHYGWRDHFNIEFFRLFMGRPDPIFKRRKKTLF